MCRHLAYLGAPVPLAEVVLDPSHGLLEQTWAPADMRGSGTVNADGFGVGWYDGDGDALRYRRAVPMWADAGFPDLARRARSSAILAAARNGTVGMPVVETACAPFRHGRWLFSHNGVVAGWPASVERLAAALPVADLLVLDAPTDSAVLWALVRRRLLDGVAPEKVVESVTTEVGTAAPGSRLNLLLTDGETVAASTWGHSLSVREAADHVVVASEPFGPDPAAWEPVPDQHLVVADASCATVRPLS
ncbi:ergothioneine biosynthesis protein EgtC [Nocardioides sp. WL0053]|uniref:Gamma-glutamyl-hercynylcysteine sulfoxide hydrolase n=1 Tax=Nocardioides jiangsuensis TaxID=2866161 RepID=A0ABS7RNP6_9ACTN|nr:ergothioneine biosynthesis protein EgtC [Nocardioides jiangsuensis]MBY9076681.1 ergothioneine biosynthesis protein EgtC [Nocardioides jiangsuensis]